MVSNGDVLTGLYLAPNKFFIYIVIHGLNKNCHSLQYELAIEFLDFANLKARYFNRNWWVVEPGIFGF